MVFTEEAISSLHFYGINYCMFDFKYLCKFSISKVNCLTMVVTFDLVSPVFRLFSSQNIKHKLQRDDKSMPKSSCARACQTLCTQVPASGIRRMQMLNYACPPHASVTLRKSGLRRHWPQCVLRGICLSHPQRQSRPLLKGSIEIRSGISSWKNIFNALLCSLPILHLWQWIRSASLLLLLQRDFDGFNCWPGRQDN